LSERTVAYRDQFLLSATEINRLPVSQFFDDGQLFIHACQTFLLANEVLDDIYATLTDTDPQIDPLTVFLSDGSVPTAEEATETGNN
jgi:hypothetical protein